MIQGSSQFWPETLIRKAAPTGGIVRPTGGSNVGVTHSSAPQDRCLALPTTKVWRIHTTQARVGSHCNRSDLLPWKIKGSIHRRRPCLCEEKSAAPHLSLLVCTSLRFPVKALGDPEDGWKDPGPLGPAVLPTGAPERQRPQPRGEKVEGCRMDPARWVTLTPMPQTPSPFILCVGRARWPHRGGLIFSPDKWPQLKPAHWG